MLCYWLNRRRNYRTLTLNDFQQLLHNSGIHNSQQEALWLIGHALGLSNSQILMRHDFSQDEGLRINALVSRRISGEPLQYILGEADFYGHDFIVGKGVLIPRHDTETLIDGVKLCFAHMDAFRFLDWGTGSGCIAATILLEFPNAYASLLEVSDVARSYAYKNLMRYGLEQRADFDAQGMFDLIISNPPYIPSDNINGLMREVRDFEPHIALDGGRDGMKYYHHIIDLASDRLKQGGFLILEAGDLTQVRIIEACYGFQCLGKILDTGNFPRCIILRRDYLET